MGWGSFKKSFKKGFGQVTKGALTGGTSLLGDFGVLGGGGSDPRLGQTLAQLQKAKEASDIGFGQADADLSRQVPAIQKAYKMRGENLRYLADSTKKSVTAGEGARGIRATANMDPRSNFTALAARGVRGDTTRALSQIDQTFAGAFGDLATREVSDLSNVAQQRARLKGQQVGSNNELYGGMAQAFANQDFRPKKDLWDIIGAAAPIVGTFAGLGGGGGGAKMLGAAPMGGPHGYDFPQGI